MASRRTFALSLSEISLLLVFLLLMLLSNSIFELNDVNKEIDTYRKNEVRKKIALLEENQINLEELTLWVQARRHPIAADLSPEQMMAQINQFNDQQRLFEDFGINPTSIQDLSSRLVNADFLDEDEKDLVNAINNMIETIHTLRQANKRLSQEAQSTQTRLNELQAAAGITAEAAGDDAEGSRPGSCLMHADGTTVYFLEIIMNDDTFVVQANWDANLTQTLASLGITESMIQTGEMSSDAFQRFSRPIYRNSLANKCRFVVRVTDRATTKKDYKSQLKIIERYYFKKIRDESS